MGRYPAILKQGRDGDSSHGQPRAHEKEVGPIHGFPQPCLCCSPRPQREGDCKTPKQGMHSGHHVAVVELPQLS